MLYCSPDQVVKIYRPTINGGNNDKADKADKVVSYRMVGG